MDKTNWVNKRYETREQWALYHREWRANHAEHIRAYKRIYNKKWREENGYHNEINSKLRYPEKTKARIQLAYAIKSGKMQRGVCLVCHKPNAHGHHEDYSKPYEVIWFCPLHHAQHHKLDI